MPKYVIRVKTALKQKYVLGCVPELVGKEGSTPLSFTDHKYRAKQWEGKPKGAMRDIGECIFIMYRKLFEQAMQKDGDTKILIGFEATWEAAEEATEKPQEAKKTIIRRRSKTVVASKDKKSKKSKKGKKNKKNKELDPSC